MLMRLKRQKFSQGIIYILLVNFINLTANFYTASSIDSPLLNQHDPIDSLAELVLEFVLEMDEETIPDTEVPHEKKKFSDIKLYFLHQLNAILEFQFPVIKPNSYYLNIFESTSLEINSPPPKKVFLFS
jgi:hypothetical protein